MSKRRPGHWSFVCNNWRPALASELPTDPGALADLLNDHADALERGAKSHAPGNDTHNMVAPTGRRRVSLRIVGRFNVEPTHREIDRGSIRAALFLAGLVLSESDVELGQVEVRYSDRTATTVWITEGEV